MGHRTFGFLLIPFVVLQVQAQPVQPVLDTLWVRMGDSDGVLNTSVDRPTSVESAEFSPDQALVASVAKGDNSVRLWRSEDGSEVWTRFADDETEAVTFSHDGRFIVTGGEDFKVRVWDIEDGTVVQVLDHVASIEGLRFSHAGHLLATGNEAGEVNLWDTSDPDPANWPNEPLYTVVHGPDQDHPDGGPSGVHSDINQVDWTDDDRFLVSAGRNAEVKRWEVARMDDPDQGLVHTYTGHSGSIKSVRLSPDGSLVAAGAQQSPDGAARVWDVETGDLVAEILFSTIRIMEAVEFSPDGRFLVVGGTEYDNAGTGHFYFFSVDQLRSPQPPTPVATVDAFNQEYFDFSADGSKLLSSHADGSLRLWSVNATATSVEADLPTMFMLHGNYPNPFNPGTTIRFDLPVPAEVEVVVFDLMGRRVLTLGPQSHAAGRDQAVMVQAPQLASGSYLYRITARSEQTEWEGTGRFTLLK